MSDQKPKEEDKKSDKPPDDKKEPVKPPDDKNEPAKPPDDKKEPAKPDDKKEPEKPKEAPQKKRRISFGGKKSLANPKAKWGKAIDEVQKVTEVTKKLRTQKAADPFLARFTVTGRSFSEENTPEIYVFTDIFTIKFWRTMVIDASGVKFYYWSMLMMVAVLYNLLMLILRAVFAEPHATSESVLIWLICDYTCDFLFIWDMFFSSRIVFLEQGIIVKDSKVLVKKYLRSTKFKLDVLTMLPFDLLYLYVGVNTLCRMNRLLKTWRLVQFFHMAETHTNFPNLIRVANLVLYIVIIIHWNGCFYFAISNSIGFGTDTWVYPDPNIPEFASFWKQYFFSFYWSCLTLTTIGDTQMPETPIETFYCILCALVGVLIFATIFGNVGAMINHMDADRTEFQNKVDNVKRYMELRQIGIDLQARVVKWFDYTWNNKQSIDDKEALMYLPEKLRAEISIHVHMHTLRRVAIFQDCEPGLLVELVGKLKLQVFSPGDYICKKGDIGKEMYIIKRGKLQVVSEDGKVIFVTLSDGAVFGEISVLNIAGNKTGNRRTASVKTVGYSDLFCLTKNDLWEALEEYPEAKKMLMEKGKQILRKDKLLDEEMARREERRQQGMVIKIEMIVDSVAEIQASVNAFSEKIDKLDRIKPRKSLTTINVTPVEDLERVGSASRVNKTPSPIPEEDEKPADKKTDEK